MIPPMHTFKWYHFPLTLCTEPVVFKLKLKTHNYMGADLFPNKNSLMLPKTPNQLVLIYGVECLFETAWQNGRAGKSSQWK